MKHSALRLFVRMHALIDALKDENGQDMVEYALVMGLIALGATVALNGLATTIATAFTSVDTKLTTSTS